MNIIHNSEGRIVRQSKNLRGLLTHARHLHVSDVYLFSLPGENGSRGMYLVRFVNGDYTQGYFESFGLMREFFANRPRFAPVARVVATL